MQPCSLLIGERISLLRRLLTIRSQYCEGILDTSAQCANSWVQISATEVRPWCDEGMPRTAAGWNKLRHRCVADARRYDSDEIQGESEHHARLQHYRLICLETDGSWRPKPFLHNKRVPAHEAQLADRKLALGTSTWRWK